MLRGEFYVADDGELSEGHLRCHALLGRLNSLSVGAGEERHEVLRELLGAFGEGSEIKPPFTCDYGYNVEIGDGAFVNYGAVFLDTAAISIGDGAELGPSVHIYAADHPREARLRREKLEFSRPVAVGENVWVGGGAILCPGVRIGRNSVIGAGSIVTKDIPENVIAAGNPCRVIKRLEEE